MRVINHWDELFKEEVELFLYWSFLLRTGSFLEMLVQQVTGLSPMVTG